LPRTLPVTGDAPPLLLLLGPTGSGKSDVAHELARLRSGEIISADAFAVYRGFDIGTAKPDRGRRSESAYHLLDVADPDEAFSAGRWAAEARRTAESIRSRANLPIVCGGSGFYVSALLESLPPADATEQRLRPLLARWAGSDPEGARRLLEVNDPVSARRIPAGNRRYLLRALEILLATGVPASGRPRGSDSWTERWHLIKIGLAPDREDLYARIARRVRQMMDAGWGEEVRRLLEGGVSLESNAFQAIGYREIADWVQGRCDRAQAEARIVTATRRLAKRQRTWLARERGVEWVRPADALGIALGRLDRTEPRRGTDRP
jgi:tRNA dimethylallyltransferase